MADSRTSPLSTAGDFASTPSAPTSTAVGDAAGVEQWSGLTSLSASNGEVTIIDARPLVDDTVKNAAVYVGRQGIDGTNGSTAKHPPGAGDPAITGRPVPAKGADIDRGPWVLYVRGTLDAGEAAGAIYGAELTVRSSSGVRSTVLVMSPTFLCADSQTASATGSPELSQRCTQAELRFTDRIHELFGARL